MSDQQTKTKKLVQNLLVLRHSPNYLKKETLKDSSQKGPQTDEFGLNVQTSAETYSEFAKFWQEGEESNCKINKVAASCTQFLKDEDPSLQSGLSSLLQRYYLTRVILRGENDSSFDKRLELLFAIGQDLIKESFIKQEKPDKDLPSYIIASKQQLRDLTDNLLIIVSQALIPFYLKLEDTTKKRACWSLIRSILVQSYKRWKSWEKSESDLTANDYPVENLFGVLNFLYVTYNENANGLENHILYDKDIVQLLTTPHQNFTNSIEIEALFLARALSSFENKEVRLEIDLNFAAIHNSKNSELKSFLRDHMKYQSGSLPIWLFKWLHSTIQMELSPNDDDQSVIIKGLNAPVEGKLFF